MDKIKRVPAEEFAEHAAEYLEGSDTVAVEKDGEVIGRYIPEVNGHATNGASAQDRATKAAQLRKLEEGIDPASLAKIREIDRMLQDIYAEAGMTEDEFASYFDTTKPHPFDRDAKS